MFGLIILNFNQGNSLSKVLKKANRLVSEFEAEGIKTQIIFNNGTLVAVESGNVVTRLPKADFVIYMDKDKYLARLLEKAGYLLIDSAQFTELCDDKMLTHIRLANNNIPMPKTIAGPLIFDVNKIGDLSFLDKIEEELGYPLLIKGVYGSLGLNMVYIPSKEELIKEFIKMSDQPLLFQEYIKTSYGRSARVLVIDNRIIGAYERYNPNDYRSNFSIGASSKELILNDEFIALANKISNELDIDYAGIDFLFDKEDRPILCEINSNAFFEEFEHVTKINVAKEYVKMVINKVKKIGEKNEI
ncbi:MAG: RimK family alpha-L-glutamate ligase [Erysipelotrichaceae bacterium]|jgi:RimK family alpha-L-glutamate ligase|nr:RimK family alpha-L-glutamate ligase [Erysipelotrichaceae bacterium]